MAADGRGKVWQHLKTALRPYGHIKRIESGSMGNGIPDVHYTVASGAYGNRQFGQGWIELKYVPKWPVRNDTPIRVPSLSTAQIEFAEKETQNGGRWWLLVMIDHNEMPAYFMFGATHLREIQTGTPRQRLAELALVRSYGVLSPAEMLEWLLK